MDGIIRFEIPVDGIARLTLHRPESRNALTWEAMRLFAAAVEAAHAASGLRALIVSGAGAAFCAGGDLLELDGFPSRADGARLSAIMAVALDRLEALPVPTIAAIEGPALGGGAEIALACDLRVMAEGASLGMMHIRLGITPAWGGGQRLLALAGYARALEWLTAGRVLSASEAFDTGLANRVVPRGQALDEAEALAGAITANDPAAVRAVKRFLRGGLTLPAAEAAAAERAEFPDLWAAPAHLEASASFVARRNHKPQRA
ncbi:MAG TPA: enoyl-CoA hydratase/isomerase family protein [Anaerolineales bacterium]|nr:enoyl-CoA hydratase/isomerase family protein [Anaerolineales bacterium]